MNYVLFTARPRVCLYRDGKILAGTDLFDPREIITTIFLAVLSEDLLSKHRTELGFVARVSNDARHKN